MRDGSEETLEFSSLVPLTVQDLTDQTKVFRNGELIVELTLEEGRWTLHDYTTPDGTSAFQFTDFSGPFWFFTFAQQIDEDGNGQLQSFPLDQTLLQRRDGELRLNRIIAADDAIFFGASSLQMTLRDGTTEDINFLDASETTTLSVLEKLTIRRNGEVVVRAWIEDGAVHLQNLQEDTGQGTFGLRWLDDFGTSQWISTLVQVQDDVDNDGVLHNAPFLPALAPADSPVGGNTLVETILLRKVYPEELDLVSEAVAHLRDGREVTISTGTITDDLTLDELASRFRASLGNQQVLHARVQDDRIVLEDLTSPDGTSHFHLTNPNLISGDGGSLFDKLGLQPIFPGGVAGDADDDGIIASRSLATHSLRPDTRLGVLFGSDHPMFQLPADEWYLETNSHQVVVITVGPFTSGSKISDVLEQLTFVDGSGRTLVSAELVGERIVLRSGADADNRFAGFRLADAGSPNFFAEFFEAKLDFDRDGTLRGKSLVPLLSSLDVRPETTLSEFTQSRGLENLLAETETPMIAQLRDGTQVEFTVRGYEGMTLREYAHQFRVIRDDQLVLQGQLQASKQPFGNTQYQLVLYDFTENSGGETTFSVHIDPDADDSTTQKLPLFLGLTGTDAAGSGILAGQTLNRERREDRLRIVFTEPPTFHADVSAVASNVNADFRVGELLDARIENGSGQSTASVELALLPPDGQDFLSLSDLLAAIANPGQQLQVTVNADVQFGGEVVVDLAGLNVQPDDPSQSARIDVAWPNAITNDPSLRLQTDTLSITTENFGNLFKFKSLRIQDITNLVRKIVDLVERISGDDLLGKPLPLVGTSLGEVLDTVDRVTAIVNRITSNPDAGLSTLEAELESALGLPPDALTLRYDPVLAAIRIDFDVQVDPVDVSANFALNLGDANLPGLDSLVDFQQSGGVNLRRSGVAIAFRTAVGRIGQRQL